MISEDRPDDPSWDWRETYSAQVLTAVAPWGWSHHLKVWRRDGGEGISWDVLQRIKNDGLGDEVLAVELYPPHDLVVNEVPMRHLWSVPEDLLGIGLHHRGRGEAVNETVADTETGIETIDHRGHTIELKQAEGSGLYAMTVTWPVFADRRSDPGKMLQLRSSVYLCVSRDEALDLARRFIDLSVRMIDYRRERGPLI